MLISIFKKKYFTANHRQLEVLNKLKYVKMVIHHENMDLYYTFKIGKYSLFYYSIYKIIICNFVKM